MAEVWKFFAHEDDYADLNQEGAVTHLSQVLQFATIDGHEQGWEAFDDQRAYLKAAYPATFAQEVELIDRNILITIPGTNPDLKPIMLMAHQDVVPVVKGTEQDWTYPAFSGQVDDTYIWGRGAIDMQSQLVGILEAVEYMLEHHQTRERTLILAFGEDEETWQWGSQKLAQHLKNKGVELEFIVDEGDYVIDDAAVWGAPGKRFMHVCLAEKGYCDICLDVKSSGGHSSNPFGGTSLATLAEAIQRIMSAPYEKRLTPLTRRSLEILRPYITEGPLADASLSDSELVDAMEKIHDLYPLTQTTIAPTMIEGGAAAPNVMPQNMRAVINFRLLEGDTGAEVLARCQQLCQDLPVEVSLLNGTNDPSLTARSEGYGWEKLHEMAGRYFVEPHTQEPLLIVPTMAVGATDARMYQELSDAIMRFSVFTVDAEESNRGVHGTDERITKRSYIQGIRALIYLLEQTVVSAA